MKFEEINENNYRECLRLKVKKEQIGLVSENNALALAKAYVYRNSAHPYVIYDNEKMIGFIQYRELYDLGNYLIDKIMISDEFQGKGLGKKAMELMIEKLKSESKYKKICLCVDLKNEIALSLYRKLGFRQIENEEEGEIVLGIEWE
jgi:diamine N-acetyltransferase